MEQKRLYSITIHVDEELHKVWEKLDDAQRKELKENFKRILKNMQSSTTTLYVCPICLSGFSKYDIFAQHFMHEHNELKCGVCGYKPIDERNPHNDLYFHYLEQHGRLDAH